VLGGPSRFLQAVRKMLHQSATPEHRVLLTAEHSAEYAGPLYDQGDLAGVVAAHSCAAWIHNKFAASCAESCQPGRGSRRRAPPRDCIPVRRGPVLSHQQAQQPTWCHSQLTLQFPAADAPRRRQMSTDERRHRAVRCPRRRRTSHQPARVICTLPSGQALDELQRPCSLGPPSVASAGHRCTAAV